MGSGFQGLSPKDLKDASVVFGRTNQVVAEAVAALSTVERADWAVLGSHGNRYRESLGPVVRRSDQAAKDIGTLTQKLLDNVAEQVEASGGGTASRPPVLTRKIQLPLGEPVQLAAGWRSSGRPTFQQGRRPGGRPATRPTNTIGPEIGPKGDRQPVIGRRRLPATGEPWPTPKNNPKWNRDNADELDFMQDAAEQIHHQLLETFIDLTNGTRNEVLADLPNLRNVDRYKTLTDAQIIGQETDERVAKWVNDHHDHLVDPKSGWQFRTQVAFLNPEMEVPRHIPHSRRADIILERTIPNRDWTPGSGLPEFGHEVVTVYDVKTGDRGIESDWAKDVKRRYDPLFEPEEIHPDRGLAERLRRLPRMRR